MEALSIGRAMGDRDGVALAKYNLTLVLERRGDDAGAVRLLEGVETRYLERLEVALARARVAAAAGQRDQARRQLASLVKEADQIGVVPVRLEATLALGTIERGAGRARLRALAEVAEKLGFGRIARAAARRAAR